MQNVQSRTRCSVALSVAKLLYEENVVGLGEYCALKCLLVKNDRAALQRSVDVAVSLQRRDHEFSSAALWELRKRIVSAQCDQFAALFGGCTLHAAKKISRSEREANGFLGDANLIYGEVDFKNFSKVLRVATSCLQGPARAFFDLGSGTGRAVFVACLTCGFQVLEGAEIVVGLHEASTRICARYHGGLKRQFFGGKTAPMVRFHRGSFLDHDWSHADVVFANSTCFDDALLEAIAKHAERLRPGAVIISFTKPIPSSSLEQHHRFRLTMSWGPATVFIHRHL